MNIWAKGCLEGDRGVERVFQQLLYIMKKYKGKNKEIEWLMSIKIDELIYE